MKVIWLVRREAILQLQLPGRHARHSENRVNRRVAVQAIVVYLQARNRVDERHFRRCRVVVVIEGHQTRLVP